MFISLIIIALVIAFFSYAIGKKSGFTAGLKTAKQNSSNLISQLKKANVFATELREDERAQQEEKSLKDDIN
jgi:curli biogenesis system outer membrane secretion channel CsgG